MDTLLLDRDTWDLTTDAMGNIAMAGEPYSQVQDVASACRLFRGELYYDTLKGVPYFEDILGRSPPAQVIKENLIQAALSVPGVLSAQVLLTNAGNREIGGQVQITTERGSQVVTL